MRPSAPAAALLLLLAAALAPASGLAPAAGGAALRAAAAAAAPRTGLPLVVNTWGGDFTDATEAAWAALAAGAPPLAAVVAGCGACEAAHCGGTIGAGGSPDEAGETTLDALVMDGGSMRVGAVGGLRGVRGAAAAAAAVLEHTTHSLLVGDAAADFAAAMGLSRSNLTTPASAALHAHWRAAGCQPFGFLAVSCTYAATQMLPLADAAVLGYCAPLLTALFAPVVLGEPTPRAVYFALPVTAAGVVLVARPPALFGGAGSRLRLAGVAAGLGTALFGSGAR